MGATCIALLYFYCYYSFAGLGLAVCAVVRFFCIFFRLLLASRIVTVNGLKPPQFVAIISLAQFIESIFLNRFVISLSNFNQQ